MSAESKLLPKPATAEMQLAAGARDIAAYDAMWDTTPRVLAGKVVGDTTDDTRTSVQHAWLNQIVSLAARLGAIATEGHRNDGDRRRLLDLADAIAGLKGVLPAVADAPVAKVATAGPRGGCIEWFPGNADTTIMVGAELYIRPAAGDTDWMRRALKAEALLAMHEAPPAKGHRSLEDGAAVCSVKG